MTIVVLGPQRRPTLDSVVRTLDLPGPVATVTAGWQEREPDDAELDGLLAGRSVNLRLYARWQDVLAKDPEYAAAELEHRAARAAGAVPRAARRHAARPAGGWPLRRDGRIGDLA